MTDPTLTHDRDIGHWIPIETVKMQIPTTWTRNYIYQSTMVTDRS